MGGSGRDLISIDLRFWNPRKSAAWQSEGYAHWKQHHWGLVEVFLKSYDDLNSGFFNVVEHVCTGYIYTCLAYSLFQIHLLNKSSRPNFRSIFCGGFLIPKHEVVGCEFARDFLIGRVKKSNKHSKQISDDSWMTHFLTFGARLW